MPKPYIAAAALILCLGGSRGRPPHGAAGNFRTDNEQDQPTMTRVNFGTPVQLELLEDLDGYEFGTIQNVHLRVLKPVWVGDFIIIEEGAEAMGAASVKTPEIAVDGELSLQVNSVAGVTGTQIPLVGGRTTTGSGPDCPFYWDCLRFLWTKGGYARMIKGTHVEAIVGQGIELSTDALQSFMNAKFAATNQAIRRCDHIATVRVYLLDADVDQPQGTPQTHRRIPVNPARQSQTVFLDGKEVGRVPPASVLTLVPTPGMHVISTKNSSAALDVHQCTPYYAHILRVSSRHKTSMVVTLVSLELGELETRDLQEVMNSE